MSSNTASVAERRAKIDKLKREREQKEIDRKMKEELESKQKTTQSASNDLIKKILSVSQSQLESYGQTSFMSSPDNAHQISEESSQPRKPKVSLKVSSFVVELEIAPKRKPETYTREVQCEIIDPKKLGKIAEEDENESDDFDFDRRFSRAIDSVNQGKGTHRNGSERRASVATGIVETRRDNTQQQKSNFDRQFTDVADIKEISKDEAKKIMLQSDFQEFLLKSSRYVERALGSEFDFRGEFFIEEDQEQTDENRDAKKSRLQKKFVFEEKKDYRRTVTSLDWSPNHPELFLASYSKCKEWNIDEPDGMINIYSIAMQTRPELSLNCQYEVTKAIFNPHDANIVIGATTTGYVLVWDVRAKKDPVRGIERRDRSQPIQKSCLATNGHNHPVYAMTVVGSQNAHNIVSISNDGRLCQWKPKMLADAPRDQFFLEIPNTLKEALAPKSGISSTILSGANAMTTTQPVKSNAPVHCMEFPEGETDKFFVGSEDFNLYQCNLHSESKVHVETALTGHHAPITAINVHPGLSQSERRPEMSDLILSSSMDWTIKLWNPKARSTPLYSFESSQEYIYDVQWSPTHPSVFASVDYAGFIDVWNINVDKEAPIVRTQIVEKDPKPLNCLKWSKDGRRMIVGDSSGFITLLQVNNELSSPEEEDFDSIVSLVDIR